LKLWGLPNFPRLPDANFGNFHNFGATPLRIAVGPKGNMRTPAWGVVLKLQKLPNLCALPGGNFGKPHNFNTAPLPIAVGNVIGSQIKVSV